MALRTLFLDMNSFFASVEQQDRPVLRGRPVAVAAVDVDTTCCIAASYEAKACGIRTGTLVWQARQMCPDLVVIEARPQRYTQVHHAICAAIDDCLPRRRVYSIDEMACPLTGPDRRPEAAIALARRLKDTLRRSVGEHLRCSIGLAPNRVLAKVAADMQKPDGLTVLRDEDLPHGLYPLQLTDLPGVGRRMLRRIHAQNVFTVEQFCGLTEPQMRRIWRGVLGTWWWHWLRGDDFPEPPTRKRTVGHAHVLPPGLRTHTGAHAVCIHLIHKAAARLRGMGYWARRMEVYIAFTYEEEGWSGQVALGACQDTLTMIEAFNALWDRRPRHGWPTQVAITLLDLVADGSMTLPLFPEAQKRTELGHVLDRANGRVGAHALYFAGMHDVLDAAPTRIAFSRIPEFRRELGEEPSP